MHLGPTDLVVLGAHAKKKELIGRLRAVSAELAVPASQRASHLVVTRHVPTTCISSYLASLWSDMCLTRLSGHLLCACAVITRREFRA